MYLSSSYLGHGRSIALIWISCLHNWYYETSNEKRIFIWYDVMYIWCVVWACETLGHIFKYCSVCNECECPPPRLHLSSLGANNRTTICQGGAAALREGWPGPGVDIKYRCIHQCQNWGTLIICPPTKKMSGVKDQWAGVCHVAEWRRVAVITHRTPADVANIHNQG